MVRVGDTDPEEVVEPEVTGLKESFHPRVIPSPGLTPERGQECGKGRARRCSPGLQPSGPHFAQFPLSLKPSLPSPISPSMGPQQAECALIISRIVAKKAA